MALMKCQECAAEVSDSALKCPKCGFQLRKPTRGFFGWIFKWSFILFNLFMPLWFFSAMHEAGKFAQSADQLEAATTVIANGIGATIIVVIWVVGDFILGLLVLLTRPRN